MNAPTPIDLVPPVLLDVNVLIALCDPDHEQHDAAHAWFDKRRGDGWATCAITENGFVRVASHQSYPNHLPSAEAAREFLRHLAALPGHEFWGDTVTLRDTSRFGDLTKLTSSMTTDVYLLGLASARGANLATFDRKIPTEYVRDGKTSLEIIPSKSTRRK